VVALSLVLAGAPMPRGAGLVAVAALAGLWVWAELSRSWALAPGAAQLDSPRWLLFAAALFVLLLLLRSDGYAQVLVVACGVSVLAFGAYLELRLLLGHSAGLFLGPRLNGPLGYVNGESGLLLIGVWPLLAVAERRHLMFSAPALAGATMLGALVVLTQSRGAAIAALATAVVLILCVPGRIVRVWAIAVLGINLAWAWTGLTATADFQSLTGHTGSIRHAALFALLASLAAGVIWAVVCAVLPGGEQARPRPALRRVGAALPVLAVAVLLAATGPRIVHAVRTQYSQFVHLSRSPNTDRFLSGGGNRSDYWRVAWKEFKAHPLDGVGAGNYPRGYFLHRRTTEDIRQPHSIELQTLAELGAVGGVLLGLFIVAVYTGFFKRSREARGDGRSLLLAVAGGGMFTAWLVGTSGDWLHLLPGVTGIALAGAAAVVAPWRALGTSPQAGAAGRTADSTTGRVAPTRAIGTAVAVAVVAFGVVELGRTALAVHYRAQASALVAQNPVAAIRRANQSLELESDQLGALYVKAAGFAALDDYRDARAVLQHALGSSHGDPVTWTLIGDIALRAGHRREAHSAYVNAAKLNPRDATIAASVRATTGRG
jgi:hypothetical protein